MTEDGKKPGAGHPDRHIEAGRDAPAGDAHLTGTGEPSAVGDLPAGRQFAYRPAEIDGQKVFEITEAGRARLAEREDAPAPWEHGDEADEDSHRQLRSLIGALAAAAMQVQQAGDEQQIQQARELLSEARRGLYRILAEDTDE